MPDATTDAPLADALAIVDRSLTSAMIEARVPGAVWGVVRGGALAHVGARGALAIGDNHLRPNERSLFRIASMTKSFTAATVMALRDDGVLRLDDPVGVYVPELSGLHGPTRDSPPITLRRLLSMDAGLATDDAWADRHLDASRDEMDQYFAGARFAFTPGVEFEYSNLGYAMLGRAVTNVCGKSCQAVITERFLEPLGLHHTMWVRPVAHPSGIAAGYQLVDDAFEVDGVPLGDGELAPMGGLWSTIADIARWVAFFCDAFPPRDEPDSGPLCRASRREMQQVWRSEPLSVTVADDGAVRAGPVGYGAGLRRLDQPRLGPFVSHSGGLPGFGSNMCWLPDRGLGLVSFGNLRYAPMSKANRNALYALDDAGALDALAPRRAPGPVSAALADAATSLVALLNGWDDAMAERLFEDNVALDETLVRRASAAAKLRAEHGALSLDGLDATSAAAATARLRAGDGTAFTLTLDLSPRQLPRVQFYEVSVAPPPP